VYLSPFKYLSFFRYALENLMALDLQGRTFKCPTPEEMVRGWLAAWLIGWSIGG